MALAVTASFVERCKLDISWRPAGPETHSQPESERYWIAVRDGCDEREWITETAAAGLQDGLGTSRVQLNLTEFSSNGSRYDVSVKGKLNVSSSCTEVDGILACEVVQSGSQSVAVSEDSAIEISFEAASAKSGES